PGAAATEEVPTDWVADAGSGIVSGSVELRTGEPSRPATPLRLATATATIAGPRRIIQCSVTSLRASSVSSRAAAPYSGPMMVPMPPSTTMTISSPDMAQDMKEGAANWVRLAYSTPATPQSMAESTEATHR